jgi:nucleoside diphosphate kinase
VFVCYLYHRYPVDTSNRHTSLESCLIFCKPSVSASPQAVQLIKAQLELHGLKLQHHLRIPGAEMRSRKIFESQYASLKHFALCPVEDIQLSANEAKQFRTAFASQSWDDAVHTKMALNAANACAVLKVDQAELYAMWDRAEVKVRLRRGLVVARFDRNCAVDAAMRKRLYKPYYVVNGFYPTLQEQYSSSEACTEVFICEWDEAQTTWAQLLSKVVGATDPANAPADSIRGALFRQWENVVLTTQPSVWDNGIHVSASAFEGLAERLLWKKGSMLYTDLLGSRLLSARIKSTQITEWLRNPEVNGRLLFDQLAALNSADCIEHLLQLADPSAAGKK